MSGGNRNFKSRSFSMTYAVAHPSHATNWIEQFFNDLDRGFTTNGRKHEFVPAVDVVETGDAYVVRAELPGVAREDINVEVKENRLVLNGKKEAVSHGEEGKYRYVESRYGTFSRSFDLPRNVKSDAIEATFKDGALTLRIPKADEAKPKAVEIK
jgi:HSP20 family protein